MWRLRRSYLVLDINTGEELGRLIQSVEGDSRDVGALFNRIVASARTVVAAPTGTATPSQTPTPAPATATPSPTPVAPRSHHLPVRHLRHHRRGVDAGQLRLPLDPDDTSTVVTTYEALRDGTTTALLIHTSDADGASRADALRCRGSRRPLRVAPGRRLLGALHGDRRQARPGTGTAPRKLLARQKWKTYTYSYGLQRRRSPVAGGVASCRLGATSHLLAARDGFECPPGAVSRIPAGWSCLWAGRGRLPRRVRYLGQQRSG